MRKLEWLLEFVHNSLPRDWVDRGLIAAIIAVVAFGGAVTIDMVASSPVFAGTGTVIAKNYIARTTSIGTGIVVGGKGGASPMITRDRKSVV